MKSMFKRDKKGDSLGLDAAHPTQQFDAPSAGLSFFTHTFCESMRQLLQIKLIFSYSLEH